MNIKKIFNVEQSRYDFWKSFLSSSHILNIHGKFREGPLPFINASEQVFENIFRTLAAILDSFLLPTLAAYLHLERKKYNISLSHDHFYKKLFNKNYQDIISELEKFHSPTIEHILKRCNKFRYHFNKACNRIFNDWETIQDQFCISNDDKIDYTAFFIGDEHGLGSQTTLISFNSGKKGFAYKPVGISIDQIVQDLITYIDSDFMEGDSKLKMLNIDKHDESYGYIELVPYQGKLSNREDVETVYYNFGKLLALGYVLKLSDGHADNIIINAPDVYWLDMETAFHFINSDLSEFVHPLAETGLLFEVKKTNCNFGIATGIQGGTIPRLNLTQPTAFNDGKDDLYIRYFKLSALKDTKNRVFLNDVRCKPEDYQQNIIHGFKDTYNKLLLNRNKIIEFLEFKLANNTICARHVLYTTTCYARYIYLIHHIMATSKTDYLYTIRQEREKWMLEEEKPFSNFIINNEIMDISSGVIPYFYRKSDSTSLYHISGGFVQNYFKDTLLNDIKTHINSLSEEIIDDFENYIKLALNSTRDLNSWEDFQRKFNYELFDYQKHIKKYTEEATS